MLALSKIKTWEELGVLHEVKFKASLSGGKGGQHVNKTSTKVELYWNPGETTVLDDEAKQQLLFKLQKELSKEGSLRLVCEEERSQLKNKEKVIRKFYQLLAACFKVVKKRKPSKPSKAAIKKRLDDKTKRKQIKTERRRLDL